MLLSENNFALSFATMPSIYYLSGIHKKEFTPEPCIFKKRIQILIINIIFVFATASFCHGQNLILNPGCDEPMVDNQIPSWQIISDPGWTAKSVNVQPYDGIAFFSPGKSAESKLKQKIDVSNY